MTMGQPEGHWPLFGRTGVISIYFHGDLRWPQRPLVSKRDWLVHHRWWRCRLESVCSELETMNIACSRQELQAYMIQRGCLPDNEVHGAKMGSTWGRQDPGGPHRGHMNLAIWAGVLSGSFANVSHQSSVLTPATPVSILNTQQMTDFPGLHRQDMGQSLIQYSGQELRCLLSSVEWTGTVQPVSRNSVASTVQRARTASSVQGTG